jgi:hypothetical protein
MYITLAEVTRKAESHEVFLSFETQALAATFSRWLDTVGPAGLANMLIDQESPAFRLSDVEYNELVAVAKES